MNLKQLTSKVMISFISIFTIVAVVGCNNVDTKELPVATIKVKDKGEIVAELYPEEAPKTVENFISLANSGYYDNLTFHKVASYAIQTGLSSDGLDYTIKGEFKENKVDNNIKHERGVLSMIKVLDKNESDPSRFVILNEDQPKLDGKRAAFGRVIEGMDIVEEISKSDTNKNKKPVEDIIIEYIKVDTNDN